MNLIKLKVRQLLFIICVLLLFCAVIGEFSVRYILGRKNNENYNDMNVSIVSRDNLTLYGKIYVQENVSHKWALLLHSYGASHSFMTPYAEYYQEQGYNTLALDNRTHGVSEGKYIGMGYLDQYDIRRWIDYIIESDPDASIILHGVSMGAASVMMVSAQENMSENVKCVIEDCGYLSAESYLKWKLQQRFHLPSFPIIPIANLAFKLRAGYWMTDASSLEAVKESNVPILFIHGTEDQTVPVEDVYKLYEAATCQKELYVVDKAGHGDAMAKNPLAYWEKVNAFIKKCEWDDEGGILRRKQFGIQNTT